MALGVQKQLFCLPNGVLFAKSKLKNYSQSVRNVQVYVAVCVHAAITYQNVHPPVFYSPAPCFLLSLNANHESMHLQPQGVCP